MKILDELERLSGPLMHLDRDGEDWALFYTMRGHVILEALPALIRVARAAERLRVAASSDNNTWQHSDEIHAAEYELAEALQQL